MTNNLVSPNAMLEAAKDHMIDGRDPVTEHDWVLIMNFVAFNIANGLEVPVCQLMARIYCVPLTNEYIKEIAEYQQNKKGSNANA